MHGVPEAPKKIPPNGFHNPLSNSDVGLGNRARARSRSTPKNTHTQYKRASGKWQKKITFNENILEIKWRHSKNLTRPQQFAFKLYAYAVPPPHRGYHAPSVTIQTLLPIRGAALGMHVQSERVISTLGRMNEVDDRTRTSRNYEKQREQGDKDSRRNESDVLGPSKDDQANNKLRHAYKKEKEKAE
ncbi:uncharacterized protein EI90DRAFT_3016670 [Cantharellus anzutake]|uniref:uncharacterized protein n=1 Tax=Cantharellus anzutake TaxID=1750568 RepID=UPI001905363D|nr:uncharacterized protein EI90DRAFT_3016670 [Cantharellus anzutake]KAF8330848.1 hypothetical protein EI90DRAFT_3016670 [Cantharellus anzutake]